MIFGVPFCPFSFHCLFYLILKFSVCANGGKRIKEKTTCFGGIQTEEEICKCTHPIYITGRHCEQVNCQNGGRLLSDGNCQCADGWYSGTFCQVFFNFLYRLFSL